MAVQGKRLVAVAAAKRHMVMMTSDGDIYTWGHRVVTPRRVQLAGNILHGTALLACAALEQLSPNSAT